MNRALWLTLCFVACGPEQQATVEAAPPVEEQQPVESGTPAPLTGFPCDVREALQANCAGCHTGATYAAHLTTRDELLTTEVALRLRADAQFPMPPRGVEKQPTASERQLLEAWVQAGMPAGECGALTLP